MSSITRASAYKKALRRAGKQPIKQLGWEYDQATYTDLTEKVNGLVQQPGWLLNNANEKSDGNRCSTK